MNQKERTLTIKEVAEFLNISNQMVYNLIKDRKIEAFKVGSAIRVLSHDLMNYIENQKKDFLAGDEGISNSDENLFMVSHLNFKREDFQLRDINFQIPRGSILTILGASGSGKTMLLKSLAGINDIKSGAVYLGSKRLDTLSPRERNIGFVFEDYALMPHRNGRRNIRFPLEVMKKIREEEIDPAVDALAGDLDIPVEELGRMIADLPEGLKQLIAIARADIRNIDILIMDEPLARLDTAIRHQMRTFLKGLVAGLGKTTVISLHDPESALALSDYIAIIDEGRILQFGSAMDVYENPVNTLVLELTSRYAVNPVDVKVEGGTLDLFPAAVDRVDGNYTLMIRADEVNVVPSGIAGRIEKSHPLDGNRILAECSCEREDLELILPAETQEEFQFIPSTLHLF